MMKKERFEKDEKPMMNLGIALNAMKIALPKGENNAAYRATFEQKTGIEIPILSNGRLSKKSGGREFYWLKGSDIPRQVRKGRVDLGVTGTDSYLGYKKWYRLRCEEIGDSVCRYSILASEEQKNRLQFTIENPRRSNAFWLVPTANRRLLNAIAAGRDMPFAALDERIDGSVEVYVELTGSDMVADIVRTGETARANGLEEALRLRNIYTAVVWRKEDESI